MTSTVKSVQKTFDEDNPNWDPKTHFMFLKSMEVFANEKLRAQGYLTLNEVYETLGFPKTEEGAVAGWSKDSWIDFELYSPASTTPSFTLVFNLTTENVFRDTKKDNN